MTTVPYVCPRTIDVEFAGSTTVQPSASAAAAVDGHTVARIRVMHSAHADRRLHVGSADVTLHIDGSAALSVNLATATVYAVVVTAERLTTVLST